MVYYCLSKCIISYCYYSYIAIVGNLAPQAIVIILMGDTPFDTYLFLWVSGLMISIMTFGKPCSGAKTLDWEHSNGISKNLGMDCFSIDGF
jgi:hypothetical protein